ncbi:response regulator [Janthinobacterium lividum]|uniref:response regulator n=1 Tax=Janthinobacterium lividum TaxID=29581 RepID=UPI00126A5FB6|nr:response regulator [Janthinobacterium lividum]
MDAVSRPNIRGAAQAKVKVVCHNESSEVAQILYYYQTDAVSITYYVAMPNSNLPKRILVVDDHPHAAEMLAELLRFHGFATAAAFSGQEALDAVAVFHPDVVLLDLGMPPPDGFAVATILRQQYNLDSLTLIAYSAWTDRATQNKANACGFNHYIGKPASIDVLLKTISLEK